MTTPRLFALAILHTNPEILHEYQHYFEHIIIDELQDFSPAKVEAPDAAV